ncbi:unnamed protein product [Rotaria socialis]|uniref:Uncharacterized protein n=1 Tax=Rotaria socialis TaxID=392032 RepID=A0A818E1P6_9BILA|nr:unnamed protein product [Rotaria socialis]CAF4185473.1 unnamed protein product [Rotaria socialis]
MGYCNVVNLECKQDKQSAFEEKIIFFDHEKVKYCLFSSSKELMEKSPTQDDILCQHLFKKYEAPLSLLQLVFADFSYCSCKPSHMKILEPSIRKSLSSTESNKINILLIGETDVDKLTLINALMNYFVFHSLYDARNGQPIVLIHVSFMLNIGDRFEERLINFGQFN